MVDSFFYPHTCVVQRATGETDSETFEEVFEMIYSGECGYQPANNGYNASGVVVLNSPNVIIPSNAVLFQADDKVIITVEKGREVSALIETFEDVSDMDVAGTTLWLRMGDIANEQAY